MKYCLIRKVPVRTPGKKPRVMWANVLAENQGVVLVVVPKPEADQPHKVPFSSQLKMSTDRVFEAVSEFEFHILNQRTCKESGCRQTARLLGKQFYRSRFVSK